MRNKIMAIALTASLLVILASAGFNAYLLWYNDTKDDTIKVGLDKDGETVEFRNLEMTPGDSVEFDIALTNEVEGECQITLDFIDSAPESVNNLKDYLKVIIIFNGEKVYEEELASVIERELAPIDCVLDKKKPVEMKIIYLMPIEVGNEAERAEAFIDLKITASNEG